MAKGEVRFRLALDAKQFKHELRSAQTAFGGFMTGIAQGMGQELFRSLAGLPAAFAGVFKESIAAASSLDDLSKQTGVSAEGLQKLGYAANQSGADMAQVGKAVGLMQKNLVVGEKAFKDVVVGLGLDVGKLKDMLPEDAFAAIGGAIAGLKNPTEQAGAAMAIFGKAGAQLLPMLKSGLISTMAEAERLGFVLSTSTVQAMDAVGDGVTALSAVWGGLVNNFVGAIAESESLHVALRGVTEILADFSGSVNDNRNSMQAWTTGALTGMATAVVGVVEVLEAGIATFAALEKLWIAGAEALERLAAAAALMKDLDDASTTMADDWDKYSKRVNQAGVDSDRAQADIDKALAESMGRTLKVKDAFSMLADRIQAAGGTMHTTAGASHTLTGQLGDLSGATSKASEEAHKLAKAYQDAFDQANQAAGSAMLAGTATGMSPTPAFGTGDTTPEQAAEDQRRYLKIAADNAAGVGQAGAKAAEDATKATVDWSQALADVANQFQTLGGTVGGVLGGIVKGIGSVATGIAGMGAGISKIKGAGAPGGGGVLAKVSGALGVAGAAIGVVSGVVGFFKGIFGGNKKKKAEELRKKQEAAVDAFGQMFDDWKKAAAALALKGAEGVNAIVAANLDAAGKFTGEFTSAANAAEYVAASFATLRASGMSVADALTAIGPALKAMAANPEAFKGSAASGLMKMAKFAEANQALFAFTAGLGMTAQALAGFGMLTQDLATKISLDMAGAIDKMVSGGLSYQQALALSAQDLYNLQQAAKQAGVALDAGAQKAIDEAEAAGLFEGLEDPMREMVKLQGAMVASMGQLVQLFGGRVPAAIQAMIDAFYKATNINAGGGGGAGDRTGVEREQGDTGYKTTNRADVQAAEGFIHPSIPRDLLIQAHKGESVRIGPGSGSGSGGNITINLGGIHGVAGSPEAIGHAVTEAIERGTVPRLRTAMREATK